MQPDASPSRAHPATEAGEAAAPPDHHHPHDTHHHGNGHHHHGNGHHGNGHHHHGGLRLALLLTLGFAVVEAVGGYLSGALALLSDAGHMLTDALSLALAAFAAHLARRPHTARHSYGLARAEVLAALLNGVAMLVIIVFIVTEAIARLSRPQPVDGGIVLAVAALGLVVNLVVIWRLSRESQGINLRAALLHVIGDMLGSVAALVAGLVILTTGYTPIDPLLSIFVALLILVSGIRLIREALHILMEGVPHHLDLAVVGEAMAATRGVQAVHDVHIWTLTSGQVALSAHVVLQDLAQWPRILEALQHKLAHDFAISHVTLQPEVTRWEALPFPTRKG